MDTKLTTETAWAKVVRIEAAYRKAQRETPGAHAELRQMVEALVAARKVWAAEER
jgi:hypothetical protein